jgi:hypothetical protein
LRNQICVRKNIITSRHKANSTIIKNLKSNETPNN